MIHIEEFDMARFQNSGRLFSRDIEDDRRVAYHGTSIQYSKSIETQGLRSKYALFSFEEVASVASSLAMDNVALARTLREYAEIKGTRLSFSPQSWKAGRHAFRNSGGQISSQLRDAIKCGAHVSENVRQTLTAQEVFMPCVYAVDLSSISDAQLSAEMSGAIYVSAALAPELLIARIELPSRCDNIFKAPPQNLPQQDGMNTLFGRLFISQGY